MNILKIFHKKIKHDLDDYDAEDDVNDNVLEGKEQHIKSVNKAITL